MYNDKRKQMEELLEEEFKKDLETLCKSYGITLNTTEHTITTDTMKIMITNALMTAQTVALQESINRLAPKVEEAVDKVIAKYTEVHLMEILDNLIKNSINDLFLKTMGFTNHWGDWEIDHCNGREPYVSHIINEKVTDVIAALMEDKKKNFTFVPTQKQIEAFQKEVNRRIEYGLDDQAKRIAQQVISEHFTGAFLKAAEERVISNEKAKPAKTPTKK